MKVLRRIKQLFCPHTQLRTEFVHRLSDGSWLFEIKCVYCGAQLGYERIICKHGEVTVINITVED